jgi:mRNA-degrading endonuclease RelE of RelBE toxin-antitoxin system
LKVKAYESFKKAYKILPHTIQIKVDKQIEILEANYLYPSLHTKKIKGTEGIWEVRVDIHFRMPLIAGSSL